MYYLSHWLLIFTYSTYIFTSLHHTARKINARMLAANTLELLNEIPHILFRDNIQRRNHNYRLLNEEECANMWNAYNFLRARVILYPKNDVPYIPYTPTNNPPHIPFVCPVARPSRGYINDKILHSSWEEREEEVIKELNHKYPFLQELLLQFAIDDDPTNNYKTSGIVAAGGSVHRALFGKIYGDVDVDLFFVNQSFDDTLQTELLFSAIEFLKSRWLSGHDQSPEYMKNIYGDDPKLIPRHKLTAEDLALRCVIVTRNENVVTVFLCEEPYMLDYKYQFVLRVYPTIASVLGGFDIPAGSLCYNGRRITGTELGMWCNSTLIIPVDTTRRSPSYEHRLRKYNHYCTIAFTSLSMQAVDLPSLEHIPDAITSILNSHDAVISNNKIVSKGSIECVMQAKRSLQARFYNQICEFAWSIGASIKKLTLDMPQRVQVPAENFTSAKKVRQEIRALGDENNVTIRLYGSKFKLSQRDHKVVLPYMTLTRTARHIRIGYQAYVSDYQSRELQFDGSTNTALLRHGKSSLVLTYIIIGADGSKGLNGENSRAYLNWDVATPEEKASIIKEMPRHKYTLEDILTVKPVVKLDRFEAGVECFLSLSGKCNISRARNLFVEYGDELYEMWTWCHDYAVRERKEYTKRLKEETKKYLRVNIERGIELDSVIARTHDTDDETNETDVNAYVQAEEPEYNVPLLVPPLRDFVPSHIFAFFEEHVIRIASILTDRILTNVEKSVSGKINWITKNPGSQWTGSINPIIKHPADWYGPGYRPTVIGNRPLERTMRCMRRYEPFIMLPRDVFNIILFRVLMNDTAEYLRFMKPLTAPTESGRICPRCRTAFVSETDCQKHLASKKQCVAPQ